MMTRMTTNLKKIILLLFICGVIGAETDEVKPLPVPVSVIEGESVILEINLTEIHTYWMILWRFDGDLISQITEGNITYKDGPDGIFKDRLQLDSKTAFLNITNMRKKHSGLYELEAISKDASGSPKKEFSVDVKDSPSVNLGGRIEMKTQSVNKGQPVTLETDIPHLHDELIVWRFGDEGKLIAKHYAEAKNSTIFDNSADGKFRNRLNLNNQNGSLTITNTNTSDSGHYIVMISSNKQTLHKRFIVTVSDPGWSSLAIAGIVFVVVLLMAAAAAAAARFWYNRRNLGEEINVSWNEGEDLLLHTGLTKLSEDRTIQWWYGAELISIAKISGKNPETHDVPDGRFSNRLTLNENTGDLTIKNIKTIHSGLYKLKISSNTCTGRITRYQCKRFILTVNINELKTNVGNNLEICIKGEQRNHDTILWKFGPEGRLIAKFDVSTNKTYKEVFKNSHESNLKLDDQTGSLTITNITTEHAGLYKLQINSISGTKNRKYSVTVSDPTENGENDSGMPLMNKENVDIVNEQEGTSSL